MNEKMCCQVTLSKLEKNTELLEDGSSPFYYYKGSWYGHGFIEGVLRLQELGDAHQHISPSDVLLCSPPKSGTTWLKTLGFTISTRTRFDIFSPQHPLLTSFPHDLVTFLERPKPCTDPELHVLATHMPYAALPTQVVASGCKMVYVCRNPKGVLVSFWQFRKKATTLDIPLQRAFELFCRGIYHCGPYWDHVLGYWKASLESPDKVLFLKYEDMMGDGAGHVRRIADFMGCPFDKGEEERGVVERVVEMCSFESLRKLEVNSGENLYVVGTAGSGAAIKLSNSSMFRKAKIDDWKNYLTQEMADKLDQITLQKLGPYGLTL